MIFPRSRLDEQTEQKFRQIRVCIKEKTCDCIRRAFIKSAN